MATSNSELPVLIYCLKYSRPPTPVETAGEFWEPFRLVQLIHACVPSFYRVIRVVADLRPMTGRLARGFVRRSKWSAWRSHAA